MHPTFELPANLTLRADTALLATAFVAALAMALARRRRFGVGARLLLGHIVVFAVCFMVGCRLYYVASHWLRFSQSPQDALRFWHGGSAQYGGVLLSLLALFLLSRRGRRPFLDMLVFWTPSFLLGLALGRIGCYLRGCCYGLPTTSPLGVYFPDWTFPSRTARRLVEEGATAQWQWSADHSAIVPALHPTQIYYVVAALAVLVGVWLAEHYRLSRRQIAALAWGAYAGSNFLWSATGTSTPNAIVWACLSTHG